MNTTQHYDLILLGNDTVAGALLQKASLEFARIAWLIADEADDIALPWNVDRFVGPFHFVSSKQICCETPPGPHRISAERIVIATGSMPRRLPHLPDSVRIQQAEEFTACGSEERVAIVGMGLTGQSIREQLLGCCRELHCIESSEKLRLSSNRIARTRLQATALATRETVHLGNGLAGIDAEPHELTLYLESSEILHVDRVVLAVGRIGNTGRLNLSAAGLQADDSGRIWCNSDYETWTPGIYAIGSVVGFAQESHVSGSDLDVVLTAMTGRSTLATAS
ncbi:FAD-dependent oxidoreductase [Rubinisphaera margarita]|uniref:FAD-dependent oxidoreductase n=1 Tax=Rubinisphaera margarita TaxID=2909586 RepID=UPI001EE92F4C|nr:FAD-dependent oxidoreductase [Rubinisphaera margarita]MCG6154269.1 FAD-dependent oxidoreductase [Rubinisphaera margarita]